jgi:hypothetical protein
MELPPAQCEYGDGEADIERHGLIQHVAVIQYPEYRSDYVFEKMGMTAPVSLRGVPGKE